MREEWARYLNSVSGMDMHIGRVLTQLEADGLTDDTIILFFGDNGRLEPRGIHWCYDSGLRVPMILKWPSELRRTNAIPTRRGGRADRQPDRRDRHNAVLCRLGASAAHAGAAVLGDRTDPPRRYAFTARDRIDETVQRIRSVHDERYHYLRNYTEGPTFASLNRYKEKCFRIMPLMRELYAEGKLTGPARELMEAAARARNSTTRRATGTRSTIW